MLRAGAFPSRQVCAIFDLFWQPAWVTQETLFASEHVVRSALSSAVMVANHVSWLALNGSIRMQVLAGTQRSINDDAGTPYERCVNRKGKSDFRSIALARAPMLHRPGAHEALLVQWQSDLGQIAF
jgi:hypothetical protein